jgi:antitoxin (DNA-binding transcriptional repressor) of toxin-antitoxin stability system
VATRRVNVREVRELLPRIEATLQDEGELVLVRRGKAVARIVPLEEPAPALLSTQALRARMTPLAVPSEALIRQDRDER